MIEIFGTSVQTGSQVIAAVRAHHPGEAVTISVRRNGSVVQLHVILGRAP
jgi:S1-C subfamily serine protease